MAVVLGVAWTPAAAAEYASGYEGYSCGQSLTPIVLVWAGSCVGASASVGGDACAQAHWGVQTSRVAVGGVDSCNVRAVVLLP